MADIRLVAMMVEVASVAWSPIPFPVFRNMGLMVAIRRAASLIRSDLNSGDRRCPFRRILLNVLAQLIKTVTPICHKFSVIQFFVDDNVQNGQRQGAIRAWTDGQPDMRLWKPGGPASGGYQLV